MNKQKFTQLVKKHQHISAEDRDKLQELISNYPYSQIIHTLIAKANIDANTAVANQTLGYAAMYSTDRSVLKDIIKRPVSKQPTVKEAPKPPKDVAPKTIKEAKTSQSKPEVKPTVQTGNKITFDTESLRKDGFHMRDQILEDLLALKESKASYMAWVDLPADTSEQKPSKKAPKSKKEAQSTVKKVCKPSGKQKTAKETKESPAKKAKPKAKKSSEKKPKPAAPKASKTAEKKTTANKTSAKKSSEKEKEATTKKSGKVDQSEIINTFISKEPSITSRASKKSQTNQEDLSQTSTEFTEDLISENLAKILIAQGKTDKAVDIYKKLIWKFPQKKAYFATQIEELKK